MTSTSNFITWLKNTGKTTFFEESIIWYWKYAWLCNFTKELKTKSQKVSGANSCLCRNYRGKSGRGLFRSLSYPSLLPILHKVKGNIFWKILLFITSILDLVKFYSLRLYTSFFCLAENDVVCSHSRLKFDKHF